MAARRPRKSDEYSLQPIAEIAPTSTVETAMSETPLHRQSSSHNYGWEPKNTPPPTSGRPALADESVQQTHSMPEDDMIVAGKQFVGDEQDEDEEIQKYHAFAENKAYLYHGGR
jgi:hypothetical protein